MVWRQALIMVGDHNQYLLALPKGQWSHCFSEGISLDVFFLCWITAVSAVPLQFLSEVAHSDSRTGSDLPRNSGNIPVCLCASAQRCHEVTVRLRPSLAPGWMINLTNSWVTHCKTCRRLVGQPLAATTAPPHPLSQDLINDSISLGSMALWYVCVVRLHKPFYHSCLC